MANFFKKTSIEDELALNMRENLARPQQAYQLVETDPEQTTLDNLNKCAQVLKKQGQTHNAEILEKVIMIVAKKKDKKDKKKKEFDSEEKKVFKHYGFDSYFAEDGKTPEGHHYHHAHEGPSEAEREAAEEKLLNSILGEDLEKSIREELEELEEDENLAEDELFEDVE